MLPKCLAAEFVFSCGSSAAHGGINASKEWLAARIPKLPLTPVAAEDGTSTMTIRDTVPRKFARNLQAATRDLILNDF
jgi:hypothetical protein